MLRAFWHKLDPIFPEQEIFKRPLPLKVMLPLFVFLTLIFTLIGKFVPCDGFYAFDWVHFWSIQRIPPFYPPWTSFLTGNLSYALLIGITMAVFCIAVYQRFVHPLSALCALLSLPLLWTLFLGQLEGFSLLGTLALPWLLPFLLVKPQISFFALGARRTYILSFFAFMGLSFILWGNWPADLLAVENFYAEGRYPQNIGLGWWGLPIFLITLWFSRGDMDMLMTCGAFVSPHVIFYNLLPLTPAVARLKPRAALVALVLSYLTLSANWLGPSGWWLGWGFVPWVWINLAVQRYPQTRFSRWFTCLMG